MSRVVHESPVLAHTRELATAIPGTHRARPVQREVIVTGADSLLTQANPSRVGLWISNADTNSPVWVSINKAAAVGKGILLPPATRPEQIAHAISGDLCKAEFHAIATPAGSAQGPAVGWSAVAAGASGAAVGDALTFTVPVGDSGVLDMATVSNFTGAPTVQLQLVRGASTVVLASVTAADLQLSGIQLQAGDVIKWRVTTLAAGSVFDATLSGRQFVLAGAAPAGVNVVVWELEACGARL